MSLDMSKWLQRFRNGLKTIINVTCQSSLHVTLMVEIVLFVHAIARGILLFFYVPTRVFSKIWIFCFVFFNIPLFPVRICLISLGLIRKDAKFFAWFSYIGQFVFIPINIAWLLVYFVDKVYVGDTAWPYLVIEGVVWLTICSTVLFFTYRRIPNLVLSFRIETQALLTLQKLRGEEHLYVYHQDECPVQINFPPLDKYILTSLDLQIHRKVELKGGQFGKVYKGSLIQDGKKFEIAAKTADNWNSDSGPVHVWEELKILLHAGDHENIVRFMGVAYDPAGLGSSGYYIITELCLKGSLKSYLDEMHSTYGSYLKDNYCIARHQNQYVNQNNEVISFALEDLYNRLIKIICGICKGMTHLASKKIVHGDLAARNILLTESFVPRICDFGMSRKLYSYATYVKTTEHEMVPWRWMAIEALEDLKFSEKSDVWAFGVIIWEIFSLGEVPYSSETSWIHNVTLERLKARKLVLEEPLICRNRRTTWYEDITQQCWKVNPSLRPSFQDLMENMETTTSN